MESSAAVCSVLTAGDLCCAHFQNETLFERAGARNKLLVTRATHRTERVFYAPESGIRAGERVVERLRESSERCASNSVLAKVISWLAELTFRKAKARLQQLSCDFFNCRSTAVRPGFFVKNMRPVHQLVPGGAQ